MLDVAAKALSYLPGTTVTDTRRYFCQVSGCSYVAESSWATAFGDYLVCELHDVPHVKRILDRGQWVGAWFVADGYPIVGPCDPKPEHRQRFLAPPDALRASECPRVAALPEGSSKIAHRVFDPTQALLPEDFT